MTGLKDQTKRMYIKLVGLQKNGQKDQTGRPYRKDQTGRPYKKDLTETPDIMSGVS